MELNADQVEEELTLDKVVSGDRPSLFALGMAASQALKQGVPALFMVDALGRVRLMPPHAVKILSTPKLDVEDLDTVSEEDAIRLMVSQGDSEEAIMQYLTRRKSVEG